MNELLKEKGFETTDLTKSQSKFSKSDEYDYLLWFYQNCDVGPGTEDYFAQLKEQYTEQTGKEVPEGF